MLPYFWYLLKVMVCSGILLGYYWFFLRNKIFHQYNRFYLLAAMSLSLLLPLLKINFWQPEVAQSQAIRVLQVVAAGDEYVNTMAISPRASNWSFEQAYPLVYWLVTLIFFVVMFRTLFLIYSLLKKYSVQKIEEVAFVNTEDDSTPFSFLKYIFWNSNIDINRTTGRQIFKHEVAHIEEKHTYDKLFVNIVLIFCWCNPFFWLYRKELNMIHEFIADKKAVENSDTAAFAAMILQAAYPRHRFELVNNFFYSPIKRRLLMLTKVNNPKMSYIARLMVLPLAVLVFAAFTFKAKSIKEYPVAENIPGSQLMSEQKISLNTIDTVPGTIDPEKALLIVNGQIVGKGKKAMEQFSTLSAQSVLVKWLNKNEAMAKYGNDGADGACEVNYIDGAVFTTAYADENNSSVFYIGIENPLKIKVQNVNPEDIVVNISEGYISGNNGNYIVKVTYAGDVTLTLSKRDGTKLPANFTVKAKYLPEPANPNFPVELRKNLEYGLQDKILDGRQPQVSASDLAKIEQEKVAAWQKLNDLQIMQEKQRALLEKYPPSELKEKVVLGQKLDELQLSQEKQKLLLDKQVIESDNSLKEKVVVGQKLDELYLLKEDQKLLLDKLPAAKLNYTEREKLLLE
jgi:hypothetical protein